ncbi:A-kinase anchor protein 8 isoform X2 [Ictalurus punctatus]|uniref:A-kinase anchor protein 8 isoform X2 n=1 Tax=Ictalurus punctatus TaxID=7998 RepID=A0A2D0Q310_ICTPU|nr:A-kinase anchor protein 8 isoform X2 [Ictalurus punctatus]
MATSRFRSETGNHNQFRCLDSVPPHSSMRTSKDYVITRINQQINTLREGARKEGSRRDRFTYPYPRGFYKSDDFISDEMSEHGSIDFVALDGCHGAGSTEMQNSSPVSRRKQKAKLRKRRQKALKALAKQTAQALNTMHQCKPEQAGKKRKGCPTTVDEPEIKMGKTESAGDSTNKREASERSTMLVSASNSGAEGQSVVLSIEEELAQLKMKLQKNKVPLSDIDAERHTEETGEDLTPAPASKSAAEGQSCTAVSIKRQGRQTRAPDGTRKKQGSFWRPGMKITAQRIAFVCSVCKFHSFYKKNMEAHLESKFHKDHFQFLSEHLSEPTVDFLQTRLSYKHKKVEDFINQIPNHRDAICQLYEDKDLTRDISMEHFMRKAEAAHCLACDVYIPMQHYLIQNHLKSPDHINNCKIMMEQSKNWGLSFAQSILSNKCVRKKLKRHLKDSMVTGGSEVKPEVVWSTGQRAIPDPEADMMMQEVEPFCERTSQAEEAVGDGKDHEVEPFCGRTSQDEEAVGDGKDHEVEPLSKRVVPAAEAKKNGKEQQAEPMCEEVGPAAEKIRNKDVREKPEERYLTELLFDLLDEEEDVEGVELGEEELGEDDYAL